MCRNMSGMEMTAPSFRTIMSAFYFILQLVALLLLVKLCILSTDEGGFGWRCRWSEQLCCIEHGKLERLGPSVWLRRRGRGLTSGLVYCSHWCPSGLQHQVKEFSADFWLMTEIRCLKSVKNDVTESGRIFYVNLNLLSFLGQSVSSEQ